MRRTTRRLLAHFILFGAALFLILYSNHDPKTTQAFSWTTIRYKTTSSFVPETRGICPGLRRTTKPALVVSRVEADGSVDWLNTLVDLYHLCIYNVDGPFNRQSTHLQVPANRGHEAMAYLTFLIDNYADIPEAGAVFVHGSRWAWHNDWSSYDNAALLAALNVSAAIEPYGYHNLRCDWSASTCPPSTSPQGSIETSMNAMLEPWNVRTVSDAALPRAIASLFDGDIDTGLSTADDGLSQTGGRRVGLGRSHAVRAQCCAQFVVHRDRVWQHSRDEYIALRQWLLDSSNYRGKRQPQKTTRAAPLDDRVAGRILSYLWHVLFLDHGLSKDEKSSDGLSLERLNLMACPQAEGCYCRLYGLCNLQSCNPGHCRNQYILPHNFKLPSDWAAQHS